MSMKKAIAHMSALVIAAAASAASIDNVVVNQMWPWSTKVAIDYELDCNPGERWDVTLTVRDAQSNEVTGVSNALSGDTDNVAGGARRLVWDPDRGLATGSAPVLSYTLTLRAPLGKEYLIVDLSNGRAENGMFSVSYLDEPPSGGFNTVEYKTTKMVFRRCRAGSFIMGSPEEEPERDKYYNSGEKTIQNLEKQHRVTLTQDFYLALFEMTEGQSYLIWDNDKGKENGIGAFRNVIPNYYRTPSKGSTYATTDWAASTDVEPDSLVGQFRAKIPSVSQISGYVFDLPTEAQWEYACRAGATNVWNNDGPWSPAPAYGTSLTDKDVYSGDFADTVLATLGKFRYEYNPATGHYEWDQSQSVNVGRYLPNAWGFYDMHGNISEICLDAFPTDGNDGSDATDPVLGIGTMGARIARGGSWSYKASYCRAAAKNRVAVQTINTGVGVRLALVPERPTAP